MEAILARRSRSCSSLRAPGPRFGDGARDYRPRFHTLAISITPFAGAGPVGQTQVSFELLRTTIFTYDGDTPITGFDARFDADGAAGSMLSP